GTFVRLEDRTAPTVLTVTTLGDAGPGSLRAAVLAANATPEPDTVVFADALAGGTVVLGTVGNTADGPSALAVTAPLTIAGSGQVLVRDPGVTRLRLFTPSADLTLQALTLTAGRVAGGSESGGTGLGGAILARAALHLTRCTLTDHVVTAPGPALGGAV